MWGQRAFELQSYFTIPFVVNASSYIRCPTLRPSSKPPVPTLRTSSAILFLNFGFLPFSSKNDYVPEIIFNEKIFRNQDFRFKTRFKPFWIDFEKKIFLKIFRNFSFLDIFWSFFDHFWTFFQKNSKLVFGAKMLLNLFGIISAQKTFSKNFFMIFFVFGRFWSFFDCFWPFLKF